MKCMKAFKKWLEKDKYLLKNITANLDRNNIAEAAAEITWREALKEVLKQINDIYDGDFDNSEIVKWIEKELEG